MMYIQSNISPKCRKARNGIISFRTIVFAGIYLLNETEKGGKRMEQKFAQEEVYEYAPEDIQQNKTMAILAYFIFFLPLLAAKNSRFARYHANQGLILLLGYVALYIVQAILTTILIAGMTYGSLGALGIVSLLFTLLYLGLLVLLILGIINAAQGKAAPLPIIGGLKIIK